MSPERLQHAEMVMKPRTCIRCKRTYREVDNYGSWQCPSYHPSESLSVRLPHACCGRPRGSSGCVAADHTDTGKMDCAASTDVYAELTSEDALLVASLAKVSLASLKKPSWALQPSGVWKVAHFDMPARERARARAVNKE